MAEIKDFARMCNHYRGHGEGGGCQNCPLYLFSPMSCHLALANSAAEADRIITEWCKEHPQKTYLQDFLEKFPNAPKTCDGLPEPTACSVYGDLEQLIKHCVCLDGFEKCWNEVMPDA